MGSDIPRGPIGLDGRSNKLLRRGKMLLLESDPNGSDRTRMQNGSTLRLAFTVAVIATTSAAAQEPTTPQPPPKKSPWKANADVGANVLYGASRSRLASVALGGGRVDSTLELRSDFVLTYADARIDDEPRRVTARSW